MSETPLTSTGAFGGFDAVLPFLVATLTSLGPSLSGDTSALRQIFSCLGLTFLLQHSEGVHDFFSRIIEGEFMEVSHR